MTVLESGAERTVSGGWRAGVVAPLVLGWITVALLVDSSSAIGTQRLLGFASWLLLVLLLSRETPLVRAQTLVVVGFATVVEYTSSPLLGVYLYRFHNVPAYVPPGHGLVYLAALALGRSVFVRARLPVMMWLVLVVGGVWAAYGVTFAARLDVLGALWYLCLVGFLLWGPSRGLYVGAFVVVSYLELLGTSVGTWAWQPADPTGLVAIGNPPSGAAGGYGWFDLVALTLAPVVLAGWRALTGRRHRPVLQPSVDAER
jgi:hypothetical protein